jgi:hypothetical protein
LKVELEEKNNMDRFKKLVHSNLKEIFGAKLQIKDRINH